MANENIVTVRRSLRTKLTKTMVGILGLVSAGMMLAVAFMNYESASQTTTRLEAQLKEAIDKKGQLLVANHAHALRGLAADNAYSDVAKLIEQAVREDGDVVYGLFVGADGRPWAYEAPTSAARKASGPAAASELGLDRATFERRGLLTTRRQAFGRNVFEFSMGIDTEDGVLGRVFYGLSTASLDRALADVRRDARRALFVTLSLLVAIGASAIAFGATIIRRASGTITIPLAQLTAASATIAQGRRDVRVDVSSDDEIGLLGRSFNTMLGELNDSYERLEALNRSLEQRVDERTRELAHRNRDMSLVLDNVSQGFLTVSRDGLLANERSAIVDAWFGPFETPLSFDAYIERIDPDFAERFRMGYGEVLEDVMPLELCLEQMPNRLRASARDFSFTYQAISEGGAVKGLLIVINDITEQLSHARKEAEQRELMAMFQGFMKDRSGFISFFDEASEMIAALRDETTDPAVTKRLLHTLKGNAGLVGLQLVAELCHAAEDQLIGEQPAELAETRRQLDERWRALTTQLAQLVGERGRDLVEVQATEIHQVITALLAAGAAPAPVERMRGWLLEPADKPLGRLGEHARTLAKRLGKGDLKVVVESDGVRLDPERWGGFWTELVHVVRNAVDHGLEAAEEREPAGKAPRPHLDLRVRKADDRLLVEVEDDGRGINWDAVRQSAGAKGLPCRTIEELEHALFAPDFSTRTDVTSTSGRGIGLTAVRQCVEELGGQIRIATKPGHGTRFSFQFPLEKADLA